VGRGDEPLDRCHPTEQRVDVTGIGDVVAVVGHRRDGDRVEPDGVHTQLFQMVQPGRQTVQVTDTVAVAVRERPRIHLIEHRA